MDDAAPSHAPRRPLPRASLLIVPFTALIGAALAIPLAPRLLPPDTPLFEAHSGARVARGARPERAGSLARAALARGLNESGAAAGRDLLRAQLEAAAPAGPVPALPPRAACVAFLRGWALALRGLSASQGTARSGGGRDLGPELVSAEDAAERAARAGDPAALEGAFALEQAGWRRWIEADARRLPGERRGAVRADWRARAEARADALERLASELEVHLSPARRLPLPLHTRLGAVVLEPLLPDPSPALVVSPAELPVAIRAVRPAWLAVVATGALLGALLGGVVLWVAGRLRPARRRVRRAAGAPPRERAWLQIVAGAGRDPVQRAVCELAARSLARRERIIVLDLGARLDLHALFHLSPRLGWTDVARDRLPVLGVLQSGRMAGLFLLARGREGAVRDWLALDRVLEELRPHFGRVIMAVDRNIPAAVGGVLAGRVMDAWWAGGGADWTRVRSRVGSCLAISLEDIDLNSIRKASLEGLEARLARLMRDSKPVVPVAPRAVETPPRPSVAAAPSGPVVLDCDLQLRHRLRFMAWMRRVQAERRSREPESAPRT